MSKRKIIKSRDFVYRYLFLLHDDVTGWKDYVNNGYNTSVLIGSKNFLVFIALLQDVQIACTRMCTLVFIVCYHITS